MLQDLRRYKEKTLMETSDE
ncbi:hypothetical protein TrRE_jg5092, partial [Triparma retinervis]